MVGMLVIKQLACLPTSAISNQTWQMIADDDDDDDDGYMIIMVMKKDN